MINESKLNNRMLHLMESGFFGKQLLNEGALNISENMKVRIFQAVYNYFNPSDWILVDGIAGGQTAKALNKLKQEGKIKYDSKGLDYSSLKTYYRRALGQLTYSIDKKTFNIGDIHNLRMLQVLLCLAGYTEVKPDGIMGPITKDAMKAKLDTDDITKVTDEKLDPVLREAVDENLEATNMSFKIEGVDAGTEGNAGENAVDNSQEDFSNLKEFLVTNNVGKGDVELSSNNIYFHNENKTKSVIILKNSIPMSGVPVKFTYFPQTEIINIFDADNKNIFQKSLKGIAIKANAEEDRIFYKALNKVSVDITLNSDYEYDAALAWKNPDGTYSSLGFWKLKPNSTTSLRFPLKDYTKGEIYVYAEDSNLEGYKTNGSLELCYNPNKQEFTFMDAQSECNWKAKFIKIPYSGFTITDSRKVAGPKKPADKAEGGI